jgi:putative ABC transport system permease protein
MNGLGWIQFYVMGAFRNLTRTPRRTAISLGSIAAAVGSLIVFQSFVEGVRHSFRENVVTSAFGHYQLFNAEGYKLNQVDGLDYLITEQQGLREEIEKNVGPVAFMSSQLEFFGLVTNGEHSAGAKGIGISAKEEQKFLTMTQPHEGLHLAESDRFGVSLGYEFARKIKAKIGDSISVVVSTSEGTINAMDFEIVGTFKSGVRQLDNGVFYIHTGTAMELMEVSGTQKILIGFDTDNELQYEAKLASFMQGNYPQLTAVHWQTLASYFESTMGWLDGIFFIFRWIIILIATLSIVNVFTITLMERTGEFGTLRAIGTSRFEICAMILTEGIIQAFLGSLAGVAMGVLVIEVFLGAGVMMPPPLLMTVPFFVSFEIPWDGVVQSALMCAAIASASGILPAIKMSKINIVEALGRNV